MKKRVVPQEYTMIALDKEVARQVTVSTPQTFKGKDSVVKCAFCKSEKEAKTELRRWKESFELGSQYHFFLFRDKDILLAL